MSSQVNAQQVLDALRQVQDPDLHQDIVSLGFVKEHTITEGNVKVRINLTTPACPVKDQMKNQAEELIRALPGVTGVEVEMTAEVQAQSGPPRQFAQTVKHIVAVSSGKGGVGKSTVSVNLAVALANTGAKVGLLDCDVYGPDIPMMMGLAGSPDQVEKKLLPKERYNVKTMSIGYLLDEERPVVWRGPMVHKLIEQFLADVEWGELDYLLVDMPPGTGDAQLSLAQIVPLTGAVLVTTPQAVATYDVGKAISMFKQVNVEILGIVENMAGLAVRGSVEEPPPAPWSTWRPAPAPRTSSSTRPATSRPSSTSSASAAPRCSPRSTASPSSAASPQPPRPRRRRRRRPHRRRRARLPPRPSLHRGRRRTANASPIKAHQALPILQ